MKKILLVVAVFAMLMAPAVSADSIVSDFGNANTFKLSYTYDGFCDGATLSITNGIVTGTYSSPCASCPFTNTLSGKTGKQNGVLAAGFTYSPPLANVKFTVVRADHTWTHYDYNNNIFNQGTWTQCTVPLQVAANLPSTIP